MIEINLAPGADTRRAASARWAALSLPALPSVGGDVRTVALGGVGVLLLLGLGFGFWRQGERRTELESAVEEEVRDSTRFSTTITLVRALQARQDTIRQKIGVIREVDQRRYVWPHLLDEIGAAVPEYTWLTQIGSAAAADTTDRTAAFSLQGNSGSTQALTRFMKNLEASPFVRAVTLVTSEQQEVDGRTIHKFTLEARWEEPDSSAIETVPLVSVE